VHDVSVTIHSRAGNPRLPVRAFSYETRDIFIDKTEKEM
jgi:hypothetical protein